MMQKQRLGFHDRRKQDVAECSRFGGCTLKDDPAKPKKYPYRNCFTSPTFDLSHSVTLKP
jgi:hypothetical protein